MLPGVAEVSGVSLECLGTVLGRRVGLISGNTLWNGLRASNASSVSLRREIAAEMSLSEPNPRWATELFSKMGEGGLEGFAPSNKNNK